MICTLQGGMGNQMFQYAMARAEAIKHGCDFKLNIERLKNDSMRQYSLGLWKGVNKEFTTLEQNRIIEQDLPYNPMLLRLVNKDSTFVGYWQTEKYFSEIRSILQEEFVPREELTQRGKETEKLILDAGDRSVFLTIRRTDYVTSNFHGVLSMDYYNKALSIVAEKIKDPIIFVFSDDPEWCKENLKFPYETIIAGNFDMTTPTHLGREDEELWLMRLCKNAIMANSSYSWWGAWLNDTGIIIAPEKWFLSSAKSWRDIIPDRWIKI